MLKTSAAAWLLYRVLDSALWGRCGNAVVFSRAPWAPLGAPLARSKDVSDMHFNNDISYHKMK